MIKDTLIFVAGAGVGAVATYFAVKGHFEALSNEEIDAMRTYYAEKEEKIKKKSEKIEPITVSKPKARYNYSEIVDRLNYNTNSENEEPEEEVNESPSEDDSDDTFVISTNEFIEMNDFDKITITYFEEDGVFMDSNEEVIDNGLSIIGEDNLDSVGLHEDGVLYVRNIRYGADYEVIFNDGSYADFVANS